MIGSKQGRAWGQERVTGFAALCPRLGQVITADCIYGRVGGHGHAVRSEETLVSKASGRVGKHWYVPNTCPAAVTLCTVLRLGVCATPAYVHCCPISPPYPAPLPPPPTHPHPPPPHSACRG